MVLAYWNIGKTMGCTFEQDDDCNNNETPIHSVTISNDYYIGKYEVTQELYEAVMGTNPCKRKSSDSPVKNVSWYDAVEFCVEISHLTGRRFTLPTEAEWEYAARGGKKTTNAKYSGSSNINNVAWYDGNSGNQTHPVGRLCSNELGIYDMSGNVKEWFQDTFIDGRYTYGGTLGGAYKQSARDVQIITGIDYIEITDGDIVIGLRLALTE